MAISVEQSAQLNLNYQTFVKNIGDPRFSLKENFPIIIRWCQANGAGSAILEPRGEHAMAAGFVALKTSGTLIYREPEVDPAAPKPYTPQNPWKRDTNEGSLPSRRNHAAEPVNDDPRTFEEAARDAVRDLLQKCRERYERDQNPTRAPIVDFRDLPTTTTEKELRSMSPAPTLGELKHLDKKQRAALEEARAKADEEK